jgi:hypothetical protein
LNSKFSFIDTVIDKWQNHTTLDPEHTLRKTIDGIVGILHKDYPQFHLIQNKPSMFYQNAKVFFTRRGSHFYITEQFPLTAYATPLFLFHIQSVKQTLQKLHKF